MTVEPKSHFEILTFVDAPPGTDAQQTSVRIPRPAFERLQTIAQAEGLTIEDLLMQGVDKVIADRDHHKDVTKT